MVRNDQIVKYEERWTDMVEAFLAAIFVDSGFDYTVIEDFFKKHIKPYFVDISLYDSFANKHPTVRTPHNMKSFSYFLILLFCLLIV